MRALTIVSKAGLWGLQRDLAGDAWPVSIRSGVSTNTKRRVPRMMARSRLSSRSVSDGGRFVVIANLGLARVERSICVISGPGRAREAPTSVFRTRLLATPYNLLPAKASVSEREPRSRSCGRTLPCQWFGQLDVSDFGHAAGSTIRAEARTAAAGSMSGEACLRELAERDEVEPLVVVDQALSLVVQAIADK